MRKDRLLKLAEFLETKQFNEEEKFDLNGWHYKDECGTIACAIGWATTLFKKEKFELTDHDTPQYKRFWDWKAVEKFFSIDSYEAEYLFLGSKYGKKDLNNPLAVAIRIREFVKEKGE